MSTHDDSRHIDLNGRSVVAGGYHLADEALERAEYEAKVDHHRQRSDRQSLIDRLKAMLRR